MERKEAQRILAKAGFPIVADGQWGKWSRRALKDACRAWAFTEKEVGFKRPSVGGKLSPQRVRMLEKLKVNGGHCSHNFRYVEFRCKGITRGMTRPEDNWIRVSKKLIIRLEQHRAKFGGPIAIISAGRSYNYNRAVGGASLSEHLFGWKWYYRRRVCRAVDINPKNHYSAVRDSGLWGGIGYNQSSGNAAHVDLGSPRTWSYAR